MRRRDLLLPLMLAWIALNSPVLAQTADRVYRLGIAPAARWCRTRSPLIPSSVSL